MSKLTLHFAAAVLCASAAAWAAEPAVPSTASGNEESNRIVISLDGTWQIAEGKMDQAPAELRPHRARAGPGVAGHAGF